MHCYLCIYWIPSKTPGMLHTYPLLRHPTRSLLSTRQLPARQSISCGLRPLVLVWLLYWWLCWLNNGSMPTCLFRRPHPANQHPNGSEGLMASTNGHYRMSWPFCQPSCMYLSSCFSSVSSFTCGNSIQKFPWPHAFPWACFSSSTLGAVRWQYSAQAAHISRLCHNSCAPSWQSGTRLPRLPKTFLYRRPSCGSHPQKIQRLLVLPC